MAFMKEMRKIEVQKEFSSKYASESGFEAIFEVISIDISISLYAVILLCKHSWKLAGQPKLCGAHSYNQEGNGNVE